MKKVGCNIQEKFYAFNMVDRNGEFYTAVFWPNFARQKAEMFKAALNNEEKVHIIDRKRLESIGEQVVEAETVRWSWSIVPNRKQATRASRDQRPPLYISGRKLAARHSSNTKHEAWTTQTTPDRTDLSIIANYPYP